MNKIDQATKYLNDSAESDLHLSRVVALLQMIDPNFKFINTKSTNLNSKVTKQVRIKKKDLAEEKDKQAKIEADIFKDIALAKQRDEFKRKKEAEIEEEKARA